VGQRRLLVSQHFHCLRDIQAFSNIIYIFNHSTKGMSHLKVKIFLPSLTLCSDRTHFCVTSSPVSRDKVSVRSDVRRDLPALLLFSHTGCRALSGPPDRTVRRDLLASRQSPGSLICCANSPPFPLNLPLKKGSLMYRFAGYSAAWFQAFAAV